MDEEYFLITTTVNKRSCAQKLAQMLVDSRLAACVQMAPISSTYRWRGEVANEEEILIMIKTSAKLYQAVEKAIRENHPYEVPEIICIPIVNGFQPYLEWVKESTA